MKVQYHKPPMIGEANALGDKWPRPPIKAQAMAMRPWRQRESEKAGKHPMTSQVLLISIDHYYNIYIYIITFKSMCSSSKTGAYLQWFFRCSSSYSEIFSKMPTWDNMRSGKARPALSTGLCDGVHGRSNQWAVERDILRQLGSHCDLCWQVNSKPVTRMMVCSCMIILSRILKTTLYKTTQVYIQSLRSHEITRKRCKTICGKTTCA